MSRCRMEGAVKLKDGLFFGDHAAAQDIEFVIANKVTRIVNCAGRQIGNHFETICVEYMRFDFADNDACVVLDARDEVVDRVVRFINESLEKGESVLVHSQRGQSRCVTIVAAYLMHQFRWTVNKALQYIQSRRSDIAIKPAFHRQLLGYERRLGMLVPLSDDWTLPKRSVVSSSGDYDVHEDVLMCNTYLNSKAEKISPQTSFSFKAHDWSSRKRLEWSDGHLDDRARLERNSDASGNVYLKFSNLRPKSILKRRKDVSAPSTAASTPQATHVMPLMTSMRSPVVANVPLRLGLRSITPARQIDRPLTSDLRPASPLTRPVTAGGNHAVAGNEFSLRPSSPFARPEPTGGSHIRAPSPLARVYGLTNDQPRGRQLTVNNAFSIKSSNQYIRPPSPMVRSALQSAPVHRRPLAVQSSIRPPSPARPDRDAAPAMTRTLGYSALPVPRPMISGSFRRAPSPMTAALQGPLRPQSAPQWRT